MKQTKIEKKIAEILINLEIMENYRIKSQTHKSIKVFALIQKFYVVLAIYAKVFTHFNVNLF